MTPQDINPWLSLILSLIAVGGFLWNHLTSGGTKALKAVDALKEEVEMKLEEEADKRRAQGDAIVARFALVEARLLKVESDMSHLPDREQTHRLELAIEHLTGRMATLDERLKPVAAVSDRLQEFLLGQASRK